MEICTIGGFEEVGKNMTAVKVGDDVVIFDAGVYLPGIIDLQDDPEMDYTEEHMRKMKAIPNDLVLDKIGWTENVRAIVIGHAHLDHVGAVPYIAHRYPKAIILGTAFTMAVLDNIIRDEKIDFKNKRKVIQENSTLTIQGKSGQIKLEFVHTTHSTLQCVFPVWHTREGIFFYALDFKFDEYPTLGQPPNYKRMKEIGNTKNVKAMVVDALYSNTEKRPGGERIAQNLLEEAFATVRGKDNALFVTTFSSHIERLNNIVKFGKRTNREIIFMGRSMAKYVNAAIKVGQCPFKRDIKIIQYKKQVMAFLKKIEKNRGKYLVVCTGHQAEEGSILTRIVKGDTPFKFKTGDNLIFSSSVIPAPVNVIAREKLDRKLRNIGVRLQTDIHVHGHGSREGLRELMNLVKPKHIIPAHGSLEQEAPMIELSNEFGYRFGETSHLTNNGKVLDLN